MIRRTLLLLTAFGGFATVNLVAAPNIAGLWLQIDDKTHKPESAVLFYSWQGRMYGRLVFSLDETGRVTDRWDHPVEHAPGVAGEPWMMGLDIIYDLRDTGNEWSGNVIDPRNGSEYNARVWIEKGNLIMHGQLKGIFGFLGQSQTWPSFSPERAPILAAMLSAGELSLPDEKTLSASIPRKR